MNNDTRISLWSCSARCTDQSVRNVTAFYYGGDCVSISRPWQTLLHKPIFYRDHALKLRLLDFIISNADYSIINGVWEGRIESHVSVLRLLVGGNKNSIYEYVVALALDGFIHYAPSIDRTSPSVIRVRSINARTGIPVFEAGPAWQSDFILALDPMVKLGDVSGEDVGRPRSVIERVGTLSNESAEMPSLLGRLDLPQNSPTPD